jgi:hypothetical protein
MQNNEVMYDETGIYCRIHDGSLCVLCIACAREAALTL